MIHTADHDFTSIQRLSIQHKGIRVHLCKNFCCENRGHRLTPGIYSTLYSTSQSMFEEVSEFDISTTSCIRHVDIRVVYLLISSMLNTRYINSRNMEGRYFLYVLDVSMLEILKVV